MAPLPMPLKVTFAVCLFLAPIPRETYHTFANMACLVVAEPRFNCINHAINYFNRVFIAILMHSLLISDNNKLHERRLSIEIKWH